MKFLKYSLIFITICFSVSCVVDDEKPLTRTADNLVGDWTFTKFTIEGINKVVETESGTVKSINDYTLIGSELEMTLSLSENPNVYSIDGTLTTEQTSTVNGETTVKNHSPDPRVEGTWEIRDNAIRLTTDSGFGQSFEITELTPTDLRLEQRIVDLVTEFGDETITQNNHWLYILER